MGRNFIDTYTISHFVGGIIFEKMGLSFGLANFLHLLFELFENYYWVPFHGGRCFGISFLPVVDCKNIPDSITNILGDQLSFALGHLASKKYLADKYYLPTWTRVFIPLLPLILSLIFTNILGINPKVEHDPRQPIKYIL